MVQGNGSATLTWAAPAANGAPISGYVITPYIGATPQSPVLAPTATTATVSGLTNGSTYSFRVAAVNSYGIGGQSPNSATVVIGTAAAPPTAAATPGNGAATVTWTAPNNNGSAITGYQLTTIVNGVPQAPQLLAGTATTKSMGSLTNGSTYSFSIAAVNARGTGPATTTAPIIVGTPAAPALVTATAGAAQASVTWSAASTNGSPLTSYTVTPVKNGIAQSAISVSGTVTTKVVTGLTPGASYVFRVVANNARGAGPAAASNGSPRPDPCVGRRGARASHPDALAPRRLRDLCE